MNKFLVSLLAGAFALTIGSVAFAADAVKPADAVKAETANPVKAEPAKKVKKKSHKKVKEAAAPAESAPAAQ
jgi:hypothetical protein